jgi:hypothetical protein
MKITNILKSETANRSIKQLAVLNPVKRLLAALAVALLAVSATMTADAQTTATTTPVEVYLKLADMTTRLLTASMTDAQRQTLHAKNFNQLPTSHRALYLHAVAFDVGITVGSEDGQPLSSAALAEYLKTASVVGIPDFNQLASSPEFLAHKAIVKEAMRELNVLIAPQVSNNTTFQQAMDSGSACGYINVTAPVGLS